MSTPPLLAPPSRHLVGRFSCGVTPALAVTSRGRVALRRGSSSSSSRVVADPETDELVTWWPALSRPDHAVAAPDPRPPEGAAE